MFHKCCLSYSLIQPTIILHMSMDLLQAAYCSIEVLATQMKTSRYCSRDIIWCNWLSKKKTKINMFNLKIQIANLNIYLWVQQKLDFLRSNHLKSPVNFAPLYLLLLSKDKNKLKWQIRNRFSLAFIFIPIHLAIRVSVHTHVLVNRSQMIVMRAAQPVCTGSAIVSQSFNINIFLLWISLWRKVKSYFVAKLNKKRR